MIGHLAWQEQLYWLNGAQGKIVAPQLDELVGYGRPASTPALDEIWAAWRTITEAADPYLDTLSTEQLRQCADARVRQFIEGEAGGRLQELAQHG